MSALASKNGLNQENEGSLLKLRHFEKATKFEKKSPTCFDVTV